MSKFFTEHPIITMIIVGMFCSTATEIARVVTKTEKPIVDGPKKEIIIESVKE